MNELVKVDPKEFGLEEENVAVIVEAFKPKIAERDGLFEVYKRLITCEITEDLCQEAGDLRRKLVKVRTGISAVHKIQKAYFLASGKYVDAWKNKETLPVEQMEEKLSEIEKHYENIEKERLENLDAERAELCMPYVDDISLILPDLGTMPVALWDNYIVGLKSSFEVRKQEEKRIEAERIAAEKAEIEKQKAIEVENTKLKAEREANEKKQEAERLERERLAKIESDKLAKQEAERLTEEAKKQKEYESELKAEREEKERIENELKAKEETERLAIQEAELLRQSELSKGDAEKVKDLINDLSDLKTKYSFKSAKNAKMYIQVNELLDKVINHIEK